MMRTLNHLYRFSGLFESNKHLLVPNQLCYHYTKPSYLTVTTHQGELHVPCLLVPPPSSFSYLQTGFLTFVLTCGRRPLRLDDPALSLVFADIIMTPLRQVTSPSISFCFPLLRRTRALSSTYRRRTPYDPPPVDHIPPMSHNLSPMWK